MLRSGAAGIAAGGRSRLLVLRSRLSENAVAVRCVDGSTATLCNVDLLDGGTALACGSEDWRYGAGGRVFVYKARVEGNRDAMTVEDRSSIRVDDSFLDRRPATGDGAITLDESVDSVSPTAARLPGLERHPQDLEGLGALGAEQWSRADPTVRGVPPSR